MIPDPETLRYIGDEWGFAAIVAFVLIATAIWFLREFLKRWDAEIKYRQEQDKYRQQRDDAEIAYRRDRDDKMITTLDLVVASVSELSDHVNRLADERLWSVIQVKSDAGD